MKLTAQAVPRAFYGRRLEPQTQVLHGAGQSDETSFAEYTQAMGAAKPMLSMSYVDLKDDLPAYFARLRAELARYPELIVPQIGLSLNEGDRGKHYEAAVASGSMDDRLRQLCEGLRSLDRPVYLRVGYEFNGPWNGYEAAAYVAAFRQVTTAVRASGLTNVAMVWDWSADAEVNAERGGAAAAGSAARWRAFYPGDEWVDWWALNVFTRASMQSGATQAFLDEAARRRFPVMIAESTPQGHSVTEGGALVAAWFAPYFDLIRRSAGVKAFCYINWDWRKYPQWADWGDARLQGNDAVLGYYRGQVGGPLYAGAAGRAATLKLLRAK